MYLINSDDERLWLMAIMVQKHTYNVGYNFSDDCSAESLGLWPFCLLYSFNFAMNFDGAPSSNHLYTKKKKPWCNSKRWWKILDHFINVPETRQGSLYIHHLSTNMVYNNHTCGSCKHVPQMLDMRTNTCQIKI